VLTQGHRDTTQVRANMGDAGAAENIRVAVRCRPMSKKGKLRGLRQWRF
jgi:hypothetical protein